MASSRPTHRLRPTPSASSPSPSTATSHAPSPAQTPRPRPRAYPASSFSPGLGSGTGTGGTPGARSAGLGPTSYAYTHAPPSGASTGRDGYPDFLSVWDTARLHLGWAGSGLLDACRWDYVLRTVAGEPEIQLNVLKSLLLNGLSLVSIFTFDFLLLPLLPSERRLWFHRNLGAMYQVLWLWPVVGTSLWFNNIWCTTIARKSFTLQHGQAAAADTSSYGGMLNSLATSAYRAIFLFSYLFLQLCLAYVPLAGPPVAFVFTCWVNSYYCFEFVGVARGMNLSERLKHHEERWAYYLAFGLPSAALCMWGSSLANAASYALLFPAYIIMATYAHPVPRHPYAPSAPSSSSSSNHTPALPSPFIPIRIPIFSPVIAVNELVVRALSVGTGVRGAGAARRQAQAAGLGGGGKRWQTATGTMEGVEEGTEMEMDTLRPRRKLD